jgi:hypothetical protein
MIVKLFLLQPKVFTKLSSIQKKNRKDFIKDKTEKDVAPSDC